MQLENRMHSRNAAVFNQQSSDTETRLANFCNQFDFGPFIDFQGELSWAVRKALFFRRINVFYSLIPKNACTSILSALASENGLTSKWFHARNRIHNVQLKYQAFADLDQFHDDGFKIVALREPFSRAVSAIYDKLVEQNPAHVAHKNFFETQLNKKIDGCRLSEIFRVADTYPHWFVDEHFAPQWSFLFYDHYDLVINANEPLSTISIGDREIAVARLNKKAKPHSPDDIGDATIADIRRFIEERGARPSIAGQRAVFDKAIIPGGNYDRDLNLWRELQSSAAQN
jgi:hypothetical protein